MRIIRFLGSIALWIAAALGVVAGGVWIAGQLGWVQPLIVISGSMEPGIGTGDLLISRTTPTGDLEVGDVVTVHSALTRKLVTHRITEITPTGDATWDVKMKGDANDDEDIEVYAVGDTVWTPMVRIPQGGDVVSKLMDPAVALPILLALFALLGLSLLDDDEAELERSDAALAAGDPPRDLPTGVLDAAALIPVATAHATSDHPESDGALASDHDLDLDLDPDLDLDLDLDGDPQLDRELVAGFDRDVDRDVDREPAGALGGGQGGVPASQTLAELDVALAVLGVDMAAIDALAGAPRSDARSVAHPDAHTDAHTDAHADPLVGALPDAGDATVPDDRAAVTSPRDLVMTG
jgi:signal peptidase